MTLDAKAFAQAPEALTFRVQIESLKDTTERPELFYSADERYLIVHDTFECYLHRIDLTHPSNMVSSEPLRVLGCVGDQASNSALVLLPDLSVVRLPGWTFSLEQSQFVGRLRPIDYMEPGVLLKLFGRQLAVCSYDRIDLLDIVTGETVSSLTFIEDRLKANNVRMIENRICAEWISDRNQPDDARQSLTYKLADCSTGERLYEYRFSEEENLCWPSRHSMTLQVNIPSKGIVWWPRDDLHEPFKKFIIPPFGNSFDAVWSDCNDTLCVAFDDELRVFQDTRHCVSIPTPGASARCLPFNDRRTAVVYYGSIDDEKPRLTGVFDYKSQKILCWCSARVSILQTKVSPSSRYLSTIETAISFPGVSNLNGTVVISDLQNYLEK